jgi:hypothetical protein
VPLVVKELGFVMEPEVVSNVTVLGNNVAVGVSPLRIRDGNSFIRIFNTIAAFNDTGLRFFAAPAEEVTISDEIVMAHGRYFGNLGTSNANYHSTTIAYDGLLNNSTATVAGIAVNDYVPDAAPTGINANTLDAFFTSVDFIGAIQNAANDWTSNGDWCKNADGTIR